MNFKGWTTTIFLMIALIVVNALIVLTVIGIASGIVGLILFGFFVKNLLKLFLISGVVGISLFAVALAGAQKVEKNDVEER